MNHTEQREIVVDQHVTCLDTSVPTLDQRCKKVEATLSAFVELTVQADPGDTEHSVPDPCNKVNTEIH